MQSQFTDKAQNALAQAGRCARGLKQGYIGTEHILVGLLKEDTGVAAKMPQAMKNKLNANLGQA